MNIEHKLEPIEHWIVDGKAYRLATENDVGKGVIVDSNGIRGAMDWPAIGELVAVRDGHFVTKKFTWKYAYIQDDSLLTPPTIEPKPIDWTKPVRTKDGRAVRVLCTDGPGEYPVVGFVDGDADPLTWTMGGQFLDDTTRKFDLENAPQRIQKTWWMNVFDDGSFDHYETKELADADRGRGILACVPFVIDCEEGEGL